MTGWSIFVVTDETMTSTPHIVRDRPNCVMSSGSRMGRKFP
jgi:hypothetical protein